MKKLIGIVFLIFIISCSKQNKGQQLFRDINEIKEFSSYEEEGGAAIDEHYGIKSNQSKKNKNTKLIVFEKIHHIDDNVKYSIVDTILVEKIPENHYLDYINCRLNGKVDREIIVLYEHEEDVEYYTKIKKAWRADRRLKRIIEIDTKGIDCLNEGYGV